MNLDALLKSPLSTRNSKVKESSKTLQPGQDDTLAALVSPRVARVNATPSAKNVSNLREDLEKIRINSGFSPAYQMQGLSTLSGMSLGEDLVQYSNSLMVSSNNVNESLFSPNMPHKTFKNVGVTEVGHSEVLPRISTPTGLPKSSTATGISHLAEKTHSSINVEDVEIAEDFNGSKKLNRKPSLVVTQPGGASSLLPGTGNMADSKILNKSHEDVKPSTPTSGGLTPSAGALSPQNSSLSLLKSPSPVAKSQTSVSQNKSNVLSAAFASAMSSTNFPMGINLTSYSHEEPPKKLKKAVVRKKLTNLNDFEIKKQIGKGAFARVHIVHYVGPNHPVFHKGVNYALKAMRKEDIIATKQTKHVVNERDVLALMHGKFVLELFGTFQDSKHLYLVMDFVPGGDLFSHIRKHKRFPEPVARFYTAEIVLAIEYIHAKDVIYRDLKPENIMLDAQGHIKIGDFGFAKVIDETARTFCGTPAYMAPEIIMKHAYTQVVDWWSVGIVCYELMAGYSPFQAESPNKIYAKVIDRDMRWSSQIQEVGKDLIMRLLESDPEKRMGAIAGGEEVRMHSWFRGVNWKKVEDKKIPVPFVPTLNGDDDFSNFDQFNGENSVIGMQSEEGALKTDSDDVFKDF